jgi:hypothetical protein
MGWVSKRIDAKAVPRQTQTSFAGVERAVCVVEGSTCPQVSLNTCSGTVKVIEMPVAKDAFA